MLPIDQVVSAESRAEPGVPPLGTLRLRHLSAALRAGWRDFLTHPFYGIAFAGFYVIAGWVMLWVSAASGTTFWLVLAAIGFPLIGPFAATGLYEISHLEERGRRIEPWHVVSVILEQGRRQLPSLCAVIIVVFLFWFFLGHMIFALFMGHMPMVNVSTSLETYVTGPGLAMFAFGTLVGAGFALLLYMITVMAVPLLLDREVDFVTAMITSFTFVQRNPVVMLIWGVGLAGGTFLAMLPGFLGLLIVLPWLGHASWHLYRLARAVAEEGDAAPLS